MARRTRYFLWVVILAVGGGTLGIILTGYRGVSGEPEHTSAGKPAPKESSVGVRVETVKPRPGGLNLVTTQPGSVHAFESADIYARATGYLKEQPVDIGDRVREGQVLVVIDAPELEKEVDRAAADVERTKSVVEQMRSRVVTAQADYQAAQASVVEARAGIKRDEARLSYHRKQLQRMKELFQLKSIDERLVDEKEEQSLSSEAALDVTKASILTTQAQAAASAARIEKARSDVKDAEAEVHVAEAVLAKSRVLFEYTRIVAPYDGVVTLRGFHRGDFIRPGDAAGKMPLLRIQRTDLMRVVVQVPDRDVPYVRVGDPAVMVVDALPGLPFTGKVARFAESEDHETRTMRTELDIPNPDDRLRDGMYGGVTITLSSGNVKGALTLPASTLVGKSENGNGQVYVVQDGKARLTPVKVGRDNGVEVEIFNGLSARDSVISRYSGSISDGVQVVVAEKVTP